MSWFRKLGNCLTPFGPIFEGSAMLKVSSQYQKILLKLGWSVQLFPSFRMTTHLSLRSATESIRIPSFFFCPVVSNLRRAKVRKRRKKPRPKKSEKKLRRQKRAKNRSRRWKSKMAAIIRTEAPKNRDALRKRRRRRSEKPTNVTPMDFTSTSFMLCSIWLVSSSCF